MTNLIVKGYSGIGKATLFVLDVHKCNADSAGGYKVFDSIIIMRRDYALDIYCLYIYRPIENHLKGSVFKIEFSNIF